MSRMARNKGKAAEREVINLLQPIVDAEYAAVPQIGDAPVLQRNTLQSDRGGFDIIGLEWLAIEVKRQEQVSLNSWWVQTVKQSSDGQLPVLFYRASRKPWRVQTLLYAPLGKLRYETRADISLESFLLYFQNRLKLELMTKAALVDEMRIDE